MTYLTVRQLIKLLFNQLIELCIQDQQQQRNRYNTRHLENVIKCLQIFTQRFVSHSKELSNCGLPPSHKHTIALFSNTHNLLSRSMHLKHGALFTHAFCGRCNCSNFCVSVQSTSPHTSEKAPCTFTYVHPNVGSYFLHPLLLLYQLEWKQLTVSYGEAALPDLGRDHSAVRATSGHVKPHRDCCSFCCPLLSPYYCKFSCFSYTSLRADSCLKSVGNPLAIMLAGYPSAFCVQKTSVLWCGPSGKLIIFLPF